MRFLLFLLLCSLLPLILWRSTRAQDHTIDFRYSPAYWYTALCLPEDRQKTLVSDQGALTYDFGPGPYVRPLTTVSVGFSETTLHTTRQWLSDPRVPIVSTECATPHDTIRMECFSLITDGATPAPPPPVIRTGGITGASGWATVADSVDPAFRNAAWGTNRAIIYDIPVVSGASRTVVLGLCESYKPKAGMRVMELAVEGDSSILADPYAIAGHEPCVFLFHGCDADSDGLLRVAVNPATTSPDPNVFLNALWVFGVDRKINTRMVLNGTLSATADYYIDCGSDRERSSLLPRIDAIRATFAGPGTPVAVITTHRRLSFDATSGMVLTDGRPFVMTRPALRAAQQNGDSWTFAFPHGTRSADIMVFGGDTTMTFPTSFPDISSELAKSRDFWHEHFGALQSRIIVPDTALQHLLDISIRNLYQISENVDGYFQFQPGPSVYRGLWVHDAVWMMRAALALGDTLHARLMLENICRFQHENGQLQVSAPHVMFRETPLLIFAICQYARVQGDRSWLNNHWNRIQRGINWLMAARRSTLNNPDFPNAGLFPPGFGDGGLAGVHAEYASVLWSLIALNEAITTAHWAGMEDAVSEWQHEFDDLMSSFRKAASRDMRRDSYGNMFLPMTVGDTSAVKIPQRAQWAMCEAIALGHFFSNTDPLVVGTLGMLDSTSVEGLPPNTGWLQDGVWPWFSPFHGIAHLRLQNTERAADILYAVANHVCPLGTMVEEQLPRALGTRTSGDMSNATGGALLVEFVFRFLAEERGDTLLLLPHLPDSWFLPGGTIALNDVPTTLGRVTLHCSFSSNGHEATLDVLAPSRDDHSVTFISMDQFIKHGFTVSGETPLSKRVVCPPGKRTRLTLSAMK